MKTTNHSPLIGMRGFRRLFGFLEILCVVGAVLVCVLVFALPHFSGNTELGLGDIGLMPESGALTVQAGGSQAGAVSIKNLHGILFLKNPVDDDGLLAMVRWHALPVFIVYAAFAAVLFDLLRRLCRNVERGESFTEQNVRLVHKIGLTIILFTLLSAVAITWYDHTIIAYLDQHATVQGIKMTFITPNSNSIISVNRGNYEFHFGWGGFLTGLLVLALGEVFRQGLVLKKDSDLTI